MITLINKEILENKIGIILSAFIVIAIENISFVISAFPDPFRYIDANQFLSNHNFVFWLKEAKSLFIFTAFLFLGFRSYSIETKNKSIDFLYAKPLSWKKILIAKLSPGVLSAALAVMVLSIIFIANYPIEYNNSARSPEIAHYMLRVFVFCLLSYFIGCCFSVLLPGVAGAAISFLGFVFAISIVTGIIATFGEKHIDKIEDMCIFYIIPIAVIAAFLKVISRWITDSSATRIKKFILLFSSVLVVLSILIGLLVQFEVIPLLYKTYL